MNTKFLICLFSLSVSCSSALASSTSLTFKDFQCYGLNSKKLGLSAEDLYNGKGLPPAFAEPRADARKVGTEPGIIYVRYPLAIENGFVQILRRNGQIAWISEDAIRPLRRADGSIGGCTLRWSPDGKYVQQSLDPGVGVHY